MPIPEKQVERISERIGAERVAERQAEVDAYQALPLASKFAVPAGVTPPEVAVVMTDGGRLQILTRRPLPSDPLTDRTPAGDEGWEEDDGGVRVAGHWREDKVGLLLSMHSEVSEVDPCPEIPAAFVDPARIPQLVRELKKVSRQDSDAAEDEEASAAAEEVLGSATGYTAPTVQQRRVVATRQSWSAFAPLVATTAWALGFQGAARRAFVGDGSANNWELQRRFFGSFVPILDFIHALS